GMKQKLAIASALLPRPALLLLDEPTAGVDVMSRAEIWALLEREREAALVLIATSYLDEAAAADRLLYLERGRLIAIGTPAELRAAGPLQVYRAWGDARAIARAARALPYVEGARATGRFARIEVRRGEAPGAARLLADLAALADGADVIRHPRRVRDGIGYMGQKVSLYEGLTLGENVEFYAGLYGLAGAELARRWGALRARFALAEAEGERPEDLPAGIRQRAGLAVSIMHRPRLLFLDEPTAGVDVRSRALFWELIQEE